MYRPCGATIKCYKICAIMQRNAQVYLKCVESKVCGIFVYSLSYCHRVSSHNSSGYDTCQSIGPIISREKILEKIRRMVYRSGVFMDTGNTRLKCPTWLPCQRCVLGVRQKRETCLLRVAYIYITTVSFIDPFRRAPRVSIEGNRATAATIDRLLIPYVQATDSAPLRIHRFVSRQRHVIFSSLLTIDSTNLLAERTESS